MTGTGRSDPDEEPQLQPKQELTVTPAVQEISVPVTNVVRLPTKWPDQPPRPDALMQTIRMLAKRGEIGFLDHSDERMAQRGFDTFDVFEAFDKGYIDGPIVAGKRVGEWKVKVVNVPDGTTRKMGVVTIVVRQERLLIKTTEWEDR